MYGNMNERIKQLTERANIHFSRVGILDGDPNGSARMVSYSKMEKFAELIVKECARKVNEDTTPDSGYTYEPWKLLEHFGIEE